MLLKIGSYKIDKFNKTNKETNFLDLFSEVNVSNAITIIKLSDDCTTERAAELLDAMFDDKVKDIYDVFKVFSNQVGHLLWSATELNAAIDQIRDAQNNLVKARQFATTFENLLASMGVDINDNVNTTDVSTVGVVETDVHSSAINNLIDAFADKKVVDDVKTRCL